MGKPDLLMLLGGPKKKGALEAEEKDDYEAPSDEERADVLAGDLCEAHAETNTKRKHDIYKRFVMDLISLIKEEDEEQDAEDDE
jgi:hypothetical protein